ncbi:uncharacterized protein METZ01_LOCUS245794 [marine metagenome]|uniref:Uncharacterized protein n=1 Tax=marine metagenome TaxID=408172 RepID=A0A382HZY2_9ZZZZ
MEPGPLVEFRRDGAVASLFDMNFTLPTMVEMTEVVKDMPSVFTAERNRYTKCH